MACVQFLDLTSEQLIQVMRFAQEHTLNSAVPLKVPLTVPEDDHTKGNLDRVQAMTLARFDAGHDDAFLVNLLGLESILTNASSSLDELPSNRVTASLRAWVRNRTLAHRAHVCEEAANTSAMHKDATAVLEETKSMLQAFVSTHAPTADLERIKVVHSELERFAEQALATFTAEMDAYAVYLDALLMR